MTEMTDIELVKHYFKVDDAKAQEMIDKELVSVNFLRNGKNKYADIMKDEVVDVTGSMGEILKGLMKDISQDKNFRNFDPDSP